MIRKKIYEIQDRFQGLTHPVPGKLKLSEAGPLGK